MSRREPLDSDMARTSARSRSAVEQAVRRAISRHQRLVLAVSGGVDSMTLLHAAVRAGARRDRTVVATFHHGTGAFADRALRLVRRETRRLGLSLRVGRASVL